jgi:hypothetical protein
MEVLLGEKQQMGRKPTSDDAFKRNVGVNGKYPTREFDLVQEDGYQMRLMVYIFLFNKE